MKRVLLVLAAFALSAAAEPLMGPVGPDSQAVACTDPCVEPPVEWDDCPGDPWCGNPPPWYESPASVNCGGREACREALENETGVQGS